MKKLIKILSVIIIAASTLFGEEIIFNSNMKVEADFFNFQEKILENQFFLIQKNTLKAISFTSNPKPKISRKIKAIITAYSSTPWETDETPYITAAGTKVREGIVANNYLPLGTKIRIPEIFGDKIFVVEDRMHWRKGKYQIDIWFKDYWQAKNFGAKKTYIEILES
jgi:3D (Asp-Asp-Asp) domain-containing protein